MSIGVADLSQLDYLGLVKNDFDNEFGLTNLPSELTDWYDNIPFKSIALQSNSDEIFYSDFNGSCGF